MYNSDIDIVYIDRIYIYIYIVIYIHIYMHTDERPSMPSHRYTHVFINPSVRACTRVWAADNRRWGHRCACACAHLGIRTRLDARAAIPTHVVQIGHTTTPRARTRTRTRTRSRRHGFYICTHTYTYVLTHTHMYVSLVVARVRAAPDARSHAHTHTHIRADMYSIYSFLRIHMGSNIPTYMCT
jgi:hypothetical protein